ncbi:alpha-glucuronidase family glycosyl hydrolase [Xanthocytophaga flava]|uniref:alpha-glucuronidase family glycosyl hydrolase n=1 Tax=Xanthocytophaga flava TaxID=3048013 RepID=UPI0028D76D94|nr:alpha-glucuronidase family glycosyl hydrolase [Xanthocytophaga flavus]MDJ1472033.1 alpha-glucuronidase family glycosyl hydrolase [Xanthocytophaga flavus]
MKLFSINTLLLLFVLISFSSSGYAEDGYRLWLRYDKLADPAKVAAYRNAVSQIVLDGQSETIQAAREELTLGLKGLLGTDVSFVNQATKEGTLIVGTPSTSKLIASLNLKNQLATIGNEGFIIQRTKVGTTQNIVIAANTDVGVLYGVFHFLRLIQTQQDISSVNSVNTPKINHRILNHWDNLNRTVERGYAGASLWDWHKLPDYTSPRYKDYARANASVGINGTVLTNVNANALILTPQYLEKVAALANIFRPYGIRVYLTARFSAPVEMGGLKTADPLDPQVIAWWKQKTEEIYTYVPDFGGFLVKANSEGQPGPQNYGRTHADGANMLADAVGPKGGIVMWRAFVYDNKVPDDRAKQAYTEFKPLDGTFRKNVLVQVKNGAVDFQPREPFHPLFGAMPRTPMMMEFQITQEYLGFATHMVFLASLFKETLYADTYAKGKGSEVAKVIDGSLDKHELTGIAGVANIGDERNWCGHPFGQANWYAFGRLAWDHTLSESQIADEWLRMTFSNDNRFLKPVKEMMLASRETLVNYMTPLGLHHIMGYNHHYGPGPWVNQASRPDWNSVYYHKADSIGVGFDRTTKGSDAVSQYFPPVRDMFNSTQTCPEKFLLWFHHVPWDYKTQSGRILWDELCYRYYSGAKSVQQMQQTWNTLQPMIDAERFVHVKDLLKVQEKEARWWRDACVLYFQSFSKRPIPSDLEKPPYPLEHYVKIKHLFVPGI